MNKNLVQASVTLVQTFLDNLNIPYTYKEDIGEYTIKFLCKWLGNQEDLDNALDDFIQHNKDCRYECYCCGGCRDEVENLLPDNEPNVDDENIKEIVSVIERINEYITEITKSENTDSQNP